MLTLFDEPANYATGLTRTLEERLAPLKEALRGLNIPDILVGPSTLYDVPPNSLIVQSNKFNGWIRDEVRHDGYRLADLVDDAVPIFKDGVIVTLLNDHDPVEFGRKLDAWSRGAQRDNRVKVCKNSLDVNMLPEGSDSFVPEAQRPWDYGRAGPRNSWDLTLELLDVEARQIERYGQYVVQQMKHSLTTMGFYVDDSTLEMDFHPTLGIPDRYNTIYVSNPIVARVLFALFRDKTITDTRRGQRLSFRLYSSRFNAEIGADPRIMDIILDHPRPNV